MDAVTIVGSFAALCSTISFVPQAWKVIRTRQTRDISTGTYALTVTAFAVWIAYGIMRSDIPLIVTNSICFLLSVFILAMKLLPSRVLDAVHRATPS